jgi:hypothetical protein
VELSSTGVLEFEEELQLKTSFDDYISMEINEDPLREAVDLAGINLQFL